MLTTKLGPISYMLLFQLKTSMDDTKNNFSSMYADVTCNLCDKDLIQDTAHLLYCQKLIDNCPDLFNDSTVEYDHIFKGTIKKQLAAVKLYAKIFKTKQDITG